MGLKLKYLKEKVGYGTHVLNDSPLPTSVQLNPLLVEVHERIDEINIILKASDGAKDCLLQLKILQVVYHYDHAQSFFHNKIYFT